MEIREECPLWSVAATADGMRVMTGSEDGTVWVWDLTGDREPRKYKGWDWQQWTAAMTPDGRWLVAGSADGTLKVWDSAGDREPLTLSGHSSAITSVAVTADGKRLASGGADGTIKFWDRLSGRELLTLKGHADRVGAIAVTPDGRKLVTGGWDARVRTWEAASPEQVALWAREDGEAERHRAAWLRPTADARGFLRDWLILAPFRLENRNASEGLNSEQLPGEARLRPRQGDRVPTGDGDLVWQAHHAEEASVDFNRVVGKYSRQCVAYAVCYVVSDRERTGLLLQVGSDDQAKVYFNGQEVYAYGRPRVFQDLDPIGPLVVRKGTNVLVFKVANQGGAWLGCARFVDLEGNPAAGLRLTLTPEP